jgi:cellulose synthase/poly-beta-1,6-N-acetylglucosamine synthase-like glycosyltransferase
MKRSIGNAWNIRTDESHRPASVVIIPTYNEARTIERRLDNMLELDYPREKLSLLTVDSASTDGTAEIANKWVGQHTDIRAGVVMEARRKGKAYALNNALAAIHDDAEIVIVTDADCLWKKDAIIQAVKYLADPIVGAVTCCIHPIPANGPGASFDRNYRDFNNTVRVGESKIHSTPIAHGPLIAYKRECLAKLGGIPYKGADDSTTFAKVALSGYRSIQTLDVHAYELVPPDMISTLRRRLRRAHHLTSHFVEMARNAQLPSNPFKRILEMEIYLHLVNPWMLLAATLAAVLSLVITPSHTLFSIGPWILIIGLALFAISTSFRTWILAQSLLVAASICYALKGELHIWSPIESARAHCVCSLPLGPT